MADTVKKSIIVSDDDNLEKSLLEEFNSRLKSCMSQDDLQNPDEQVDEVDEVNSIYENIEELQVKENVSKSTAITSTTNFLKNENENYYEEPNIIKNGGTNGHTSHKSNGHHSQLSDDDIYENLAHQTNNDKTDNKMDQYVEMHSNSDNIPVIASSKSINSEEYEEVVTVDNIPEDIKNQYETISEVKKPNFTLQIDETNESEPSEGKSVKNRMFLSTNDTSCLLFTQTVTSPMLTPSEENIDFLKGFQRESPPTLSENTESQKLENQDSNDLDQEDIESDHLNDEKIYENAEAINGNIENVYENCQLSSKENIYENVECAKLANESEESLYQNVEVLKNEITFTSPLQDISTEFINNEKLKSQFSKQLSNNVSDTENENQKVVTSQKTLNEEKSNKQSPDALQNNKNNLFRDEKYTEFVSHTKSEVTSKYTEKYTEVVSRTVEVNNREKDTETVPAQIVKNLKSQFAQNATESKTTAVSKKENYSNETKLVNIMQQINKFENKDTDFSENDNSTETITESYVETTVEVANGEKGMKKKKAKKSKREEKENISVNGNNVEENFYNVNVKNLCRSFGDLSKIGNGIGQYNVRAKSLNDVTLTATSNRYIENVFFGVSVRNLRDKFSSDTKISVGSSSKFQKPEVKSSFNKFDALQKKNLLHVRSSDSSKAQEKFNGAQIDLTNCKACGKPVFQMEQIKAEKAVWHKNCFRCQECSKQLNVDTYESHEGTLYCKPHFKALFAPKVVEDEEPPSDKPDLGLEELQSLNVKERFQVFENYQSEMQENEKYATPVNVKRSPSILSKLAKFQAKGMDVGVADDSLNGIPIEESSSEEEEVEEVEGEDADLVRARRVQKEKPFHFTGMSDVKSKWEHGEQKAREERREERKQEIQSIRNRLFMGKQEKMKEAYQQAVMQSESCANIAKNAEKIESCDTRSIKERFEKGDVVSGKQMKERDEEEVYESEISKQSRSLFLELDANASKPPQISPVTPPKFEVKKAREAFLAKVASEDTVKSSEQVDDVTVETADIQQKFKFFETYKEPEKRRKQFRITPPREGQVKEDTPEREIYHDPDVVRSEEYVEDSVIAEQSHTATKMLNKFRQMEENLSKEPVAAGPKPLKRFTPPPEPARPESNSEEESGSEEEEEIDEGDNSKLPQDLIEAQKAARAKMLRAKFEKWEANEIKNNNSSVNVTEEYGEEQSQIESTKTLRARFESLKETSSVTSKQPRVKVNRFVEFPNVTETCQSCKGRVYPLEKISVHGLIFHKKCFKCMECSCILRMDSYSYNQGLLYCTPHFKRLFISKGNYDTAFGLEQHKEKWNGPNATIA